MYVLYIYILHFSAAFDCFSFRDNFMKLSVLPNLCDVKCTYGYEVIEIQN